MIRLLDHLVAGGLSAADAKRALSSGKVFYRGIPVGDPVRMVEGPRVKLNMSAPKTRPGTEPHIVFSDDHLAVIMKPSGMLSVAAPGRRGEPELLGWARQRLGEVHRVHRLDEDTSGLILVARSERVRSYLITLVSLHRMERGYLAFVAGNVPNKPRKIVSVIARDRGDGIRGANEEEDGKEAVTHLVRSQSFGMASLVELKLETGRQHQIRIHMSEEGHPVLADKLYGRPMPRAPRLALHAFKLGFRHPVTTDDVRFEVPLPDDLERLKCQLTAQAEEKAAERAARAERFSKPPQG